MTKETIRIIEALRKISDSEWEEVKAKMLDSIMEEEKNEVVKPKVENLEKKVYDLVRELGVPSDIKGFNYIRKAVMLGLEDSEMGRWGFINQKLYPTIAKEFDTTRSSVERAIRHAIEIAWDRANIEKINEVFGYSFSPETGRTTNAEFIAGIIDYIQL